MISESMNYKYIKRTALFALMLIITTGAYTQPIGYRTQENIAYYPNIRTQTDAYLQERCVLDIYYPQQTKGFATIIWFHGGGLTAGNKYIPQALKEKGMAVVAVNYRLAPNVKSPAYIEDAAAAVAWVFNNITRFGGDSTLIFVSGHSAGGYLTSMVGLDKRWLAKNQIEANRIAGLIPLSGQTITHFSIRNERGISDTQPLVDEMAPLFHVRADAPPMLLITGDRELEMLGRYEENAYLMRMMKVKGHKQTVLYELDGYGHNMEEPAFPLLVKWIQQIIEQKACSK